MPHAYVHTGFWTKYGAPLYTRWPLTLSNLQAVVLFCAVSIFLAYVQARAWVLVRFVTIKITIPIHLPSDVNDLSQGCALASLAQSVRSAFVWSRRGEEDLSPWRYKLSPVFGIIAILNILVFIGMGVTVPYLLTDGVWGVPEVRSQRTDACLDDIEGAFPGDFWDAKGMLPDEIWEHCHGVNNIDASCDPNFADIRGFSTVISEGCPLSHICIDGLPTVTFTRANLTAYDLGISSRLEMTASQRMSCSPISLRPFTREGPGDSGLGRFSLSIANPILTRYEYNANLSLPLWTNNTPESGREVFNKGGVFQLQVLPKNPLRRYGNIFNLHPSLARRDGHVFVIILKAGRTLYSATPGPISDPFFTANTILSESNSSTNEIFYFPDMEATALGCIEQVQVCLTSDNTCDPWSAHLITADRAFKELRKSQGDEIAWDYFDVFSRSLEYSSVHALLRSRMPLPRPVLLAPYHYSNSTSTGILHNIDPKRQWIFDLEALFTKASYWRKIQMLAIVQNSFIPENATLPSFLTLMKRKSLCNRIIFRDSGYVTIDWMGLCATMLSLFVIWLLSYSIPSVEWLLEIFLAATSRFWEHVTSTDSDPLPKSRWWERIRFQKICKALFLPLERERYQSLGINLDTLREEDPDNPI
jgi:hypothetical protein